MITRQYAYFISSDSSLGFTQVTDGGASLSVRTTDRPHVPEDALNFRVTANTVYFTNAARNITSANNSITVDAPTVANPLVIATNQVIIIPPGNYTLPDIVDTLLSGMTNHTTPLLTTGLVFTFNDNTLRVEVTVATDYRIDFTVAGNPRVQLGFGSIDMTPGSYTAENLPVRNSHELVHISCSLVDKGVSVSDVYQNVITTIPVTVGPGMTQVHHQAFPLYLSAKKLSDAYIQKVDVAILDANMQPLDLQGTAWGVKLSLIWDEFGTPNKRN